MRKVTFATLTLALILLAPAWSLKASAASSGTGTTFHSRIGRFLGIIPSRNQLASLPCTPAGSLFGLATCTGQLYYNGGPVMTTNKVYAIYWVPRTFTVSGNYESLINQYFKDVQASTGKNSNAYAAGTQYYQQNNGATSYVQNNTTFEGSIVDSNPLPPLDPTNCPDVASPLNGTNGTPSTPTGCVTDAQLQQEISNVIKANNLPVDQNTEFFMFTAKNIGTCFSANLSSGTANVNAPLCSFQYFCAYHSSYVDPTVSGSSAIIYANMPYAAETTGMPLTCDDGQYPNNDDADATINVTSHEHNESITDPFGNAWWDSNSNDGTYGNEDGDMCAWTFSNGLQGGPYGPSGAEYTQTINGHHYWMQQEWSNADLNNASAGCVQYESPHISLTPNIGYASAPFKVTGMFFNAGTQPSYSFQDANGVTTALGQAGAADASGQVSYRTAVPTGAAAGQGQVLESSPDGNTSATFTVPTF